MPPQYKKLYLGHDEMRASLNLQVLAHLVPERINWPDEPWNPTSGIAKILKGIRSKCH